MPSPFASGRGKAAGQRGPVSSEAVSGGQSPPWSARGAARGRAGLFVPSRLAEPGAVHVGAAGSAEGTSREQAWGNKGRKAGPVAG